MQATILSQDSPFELAVTDSDGAVHEVTIQQDGTVTEHSVDGQPLEARQAPGRSERDRQVLRFGKYYLYRKQGETLLSPYTSPDQITYPERVAVAILVLGGMSLETVEAEFETLYYQRKRAVTDAPAPIEPPANGQECTRIEQDIHLSVPADRLQALLDVMIELEAFGGLRQLLDMCPNKDDSQLSNRLARIIGSEPTEADSVGGLLSSKSAIRVHWETEGMKQVEYGPGTGSEHGTLAVRIQLPVSSKPIRSVDAFHRLLIDHLRCQLRDCYIGMGLAPPRDLQIRGPGIASLSNVFVESNEYQRYDSPEAVIDWTRLDPLPSL